MGDQVEVSSGLRGADKGPPGTIVILVGGRSFWGRVDPGQVLVAGSDPACGIFLDEPSVSRWHARIQRLGPGWLVSGLDPANPAWLIDARGRPIPIETELGLRSGELLIGSARVRLYPPA